MKVVLETERLLLRHLTESDADCVVACVTDENLASVRVLEMAGLRRVGEPICLLGEDQRGVKYALTKDQFDP